MGQSTVCSFCQEEKEKEENLITSKNTDFFICETKTKNVDRPILKSQKLNFSLNLNNLDCNSHVVQEGFGIIYFTNNSLFKGLFHNGIPNSWGIYFNPSNGLFQGEYKNDKPNGYGIYEHITESTYEGYWLNEKQEGIGIEIWVDSSIYKGQFKSGKKNGNGTYIFPNNNIYLGEWSENLMNGYGIYNYGKNNIYMGAWKNGLRDGYGEVYEPDNNYFFGFYKNNLQNGFFMFYNKKNDKMIVGYNNNGKVDRIAKYFRKEKQGKLIILKNCKKVKEIEEEDKIINYLNDKNNFDYKIMDDYYKKYFYMKREELEEILINKCNNININEIKEILKSIKKEYT